MNIYLLIAAAVCFVLDALHVNILNIGLVSLGFALVTVSFII